jgi:serine protease Do
MLTVGPTKARQRGQRSVGTAFAVGAPGTWLTARHVIDGCERLQLRRGDVADPITVTYVHRSADIAVLRAPQAGPPLPVTAGPLALGEDGFAFGIAGQGGPSAVHGALIGRARVLQSGRLSGTTEVTVWAERAIVPPGERWIGGMSGGPMLTAEGAVTGLLSVASQRRGRVFMVAPEVVSQVLRDNKIGFVPAGAEPAAATAASMERMRDTLLRRRTVAQVMCTA